MSSAKWQPFFISLNVSNTAVTNNAIFSWANISIWPYLTYVSLPSTPVCLHNKCHVDRKLLLIYDITVQNYITHREGSEVLPSNRAYHPGGHYWDYYLGALSLTHWGRDKMAAVSQTTLSNAFSWMKIHQFRLIYHGSLFLWVELTIFQHWFR